jgi:hypothetical protein
MADKPNCYNCKYRGRVLGSAHSSCQHPAVKNELADSALSIFAILASVGRTAPMQADALGVMGNPHGIARGWFNWPWDFDPVWLLTCEGFEVERRAG